MRTAGSLDCGDLLPGLPSDPCWGRAACLRRELQQLALVQDRQAGLGWVSGVATLWQAHWLDGGCGRARPGIWAW